MTLPLKMSMTDLYSVPNDHRRDVSEETPLLH